MLLWAASLQVCQLVAQQNPAEFKEYLSLSPKSCHYQWVFGHLDGELRLELGDLLKGPKVAME